MKLSQLMPAGDYLSYKGDWVTNTAYNVNECVTWTDGHLYQVIKEHTSSDTIAPSNTEYYKAMTARKVTPHNFKNLTGTYNYVNSVPLDRIKYITIKANDKVWTLMPQTSTKEYAAIQAYSDDGGYTIIVLKIQPNTPIAFYINTYSGGGRDKYMIRDISEYTVYVEE